jgi:uncharacterized membrane protein
MRTFRITTEEIFAPAERTWQVMSDVERWPEWTPSVTSVTLLDGPGRPLAVGSRAVIRQPKFPPALWKVTEIEPGRRFTWVSVAPGLRVAARHSVESTDKGSRGTLSLEMQGLLGGVWGRLTKGITERYLALEAKGLKARSENSAFRHADSPS